MCIRACQAMQKTNHKEFTCAFIRGFGQLSLLAGDSPFVSFTLPHQKGEVRHAIQGVKAQGMLLPVCESASGNSQNHVGFYLCLTDIACIVYAMSE
jgi:hypothetical protein